MTSQSPLGSFFIFSKFVEPEKIQPIATYGQTSLYLDIIRHKTRLLLHIFEDEIKNRQKTGYVIVFLVLSVFACTYSPFERNKSKTKCAERKTTVAHTMRTF